MLYYFGCFYAQRAVNIIIKIGKPVFKVKLVKRKQNFLGAANAESRKYKLAFSLYANLIDPGQQNIGCGYCRIMQTVSIC